MIILLQRYWSYVCPQLRDTRVEILNFLGAFLQRMSVTVRGWEKNYAVDLKVPSAVGKFLSGLASHFNVYI